MWQFILILILTFLFPYHGANRAGVAGGGGEEWCEEVGERTAGRRRMRGE